MKEHTKILPCPKCGSEADWWDFCGNGFITCKNKKCHYHGDVHTLYDSYDCFSVIESAIKEWNNER